jgi:hypothetical protein|tara:strand:+ start:625 stop:744 length:120 start_codon:yes stop_codon:yes gene_type:complete
LEDRYPHEEWQQAKDRKKYFFQSDEQDAFNEDANYCEKV